jgi:hypothetical protein
MPSKFVTRSAERAGVSVEKAEEVWSDAKHSVKKGKRRGHWYWGRVVNAFKKMMGLTESASFSEWAEILIEEEASEDWEYIQVVPVGETWPEQAQDLWKILDSVYGKQGWGPGAEGTEWLEGWSGRPQPTPRDALPPMPFLIKPSNNNYQKLKAAGFQMHFIESASLEEEHGGHRAVDMPDVINFGGGLVGTVWSRAANHVTYELELLMSDEKLAHLSIKQDNPNRPEDSMWSWRLQEFGGEVVAQRDFLRLDIAGEVKALIHFVNTAVRSGTFQLGEAKNPQELNPKDAVKKFPPTIYIGDGGWLEFVEHGRGQVRYHIYELMTEKPIGCFIVLKRGEKWWWQIYRVNSETGKLLGGPIATGVLGLEDDPSNIEQMKNWVKNNMGVLKL